MVNKDLTNTSTCFVICPFGNEGSSEDEVRIYQEIRNLTTNIFAPAQKILLEQGHTVQISDARNLDAEQDTIRNKVIELIDQADVVIFVMTADKPNGFIEYGWSMGLWKTPIILKRDEYTPPTNINNNLAVEYSSRDIDGSNPDRAQRVVDQLVQQIKKKLDRTPAARPFEHFPPTMLAHGVVDVLGRFRDISPRQWSDMLNAAEEEIILASSTMLKPFEQQFFDRDGSPIDIDELVLKKALEDGVRVTVLMQHPDNTSLDHLRKNVAKKGVSSARDDQEKSFRLWASTQQVYEQALRQRGDEVPHDGFRVIRLRNRFLPFRVTFTDKEMYLTLRFYTQLFNSGLCLVTKPGPTDQDTENPSVYRQIRDELEFLISENAGPSGDDYAAFVQTQPLSGPK